MALVDMGVQVDEAGPDHARVQVDRRRVAVVRPGGQDFGDTAI